MLAIGDKNVKDFFSSLVWFAREPTTSRITAYDRHIFLYARLYNWVHAFYNAMTSIEILSIAGQGMFVVPWTAKSKFSLWWNSRKSLPNVASDEWWASSGEASVLERSLSATEYRRTWSHRDKPLQITVSTQRHSCSPSLLCQRKLRYSYSLPLPCPLYAVLSSDSF